MDLPIDSSSRYSAQHEFSYQETLKNYGFSMPTTDLRNFLELLTAAKNRSTKYAKPSQEFMQFGNNTPPIDTTELDSMWPLTLCDAYVGFYMEDDMKYRLGEIKGVNSSHQKIEGYTDEFGNLSTAANLDIAFSNEYLFYGEIIDGKQRYINMLFGPYINDDNEIATTLEWWNDYKSYVRKSIYSESEFSRENLLRTSAGATWRGGSFKQVNDNIMLMQKLYEGVTGIVSTYITEYDLSIFMQENYVGSESVSATGRKTRSFYCPLLYGLDKSISLSQDKDFTYTYGVVNAALSVWSDEQQNFFEPFKYPLSTYWRPYYNFEYQHSAYKAYYEMLLDQRCSPIFTNYKWTYNGKQYDAHSVKQLLRYDDYAGAAVSRWQRIETFRYFQVFYIEPGFGYDVLELDIPDSLWDAILRALDKLNKLLKDRGDLRGILIPGNEATDSGLNGSPNINENKNGAYCFLSTCNGEIGTPPPIVIKFHGFVGISIKLELKLGPFSFESPEVGFGALGRHSGGGGGLYATIRGTKIIDNLFDTLFGRGLINQAKDGSLVAKIQNNSVMQQSGVTVRGGSGGGGDNDGDSIHVQGTNGSSGGTGIMDSLTSKYGNLDVDTYIGLNPVNGANIADVPMYDEMGNPIVYPVDESSGGLKYAKSSGIATYNPVIYGGPHGEFYNPNTPQGYFENKNSFWYNCPRLGLQENKQDNIISIDKALSPMKNGIVFSYKDTYMLNESQIQYDRLDFNSFINKKWKIYRIDVDIYNVTAEHKTWWNSLISTVLGSKYYNYNIEKESSTETYILEFDYQEDQNNFIEYLQKRTNPFIKDDSINSKLNFTFIQTLKGKYIQLFRTNVVLDSINVTINNQITTKNIIKVDLYKNPIYQLDLRENSYYDSDDLSGNYLKNTSEYNYEVTESLMHPMYYARQDKQMQLQFDEVVQTKSDFYIEGNGILGCIKGIESDVVSNVGFDNKSIMSSYNTLEDIKYKQLKYFTEVETSEYINTNNSLYYFPNRTRVVEKDLPFTLNLAINNAFNKVDIGLSSASEKIYHSKQHFEKYDTTSWGPVELDFSEIEGTEAESDERHGQKSFALTYAVKMLFSNMLKYKSSLTNAIETFKFINFDAVRLVLKQCVEPEVILASQKMPQNVNADSPQISPNFNYWIHRAIQIFGDIALDIDTTSKKKQFMDMLYARRDKVEAALRLIDVFTKSNTITYNDLTKVKSAITMYNDITKDETVDEWFTVYLQVLYQYRRYFINSRFNKTDGTMIRVAALERVLPIACEYALIDPTFAKDIQIDNIQEDLKVYYKQSNHTLYEKSLALVNGVDLGPDRVKYIFTKVEYVPDLGNNVGENDWVLPKDHEAEKVEIIKVTESDNKNVVPGFYTEHKGLLRQVVWVPYRARWAFKPIDGKYELISAEVQKNKEDESYNKEFLDIAGVDKERELADNGYKNLKKTFDHEDCIMHIKFDVEKTTTDHTTEWSATRKESIHMDKDCAIYFNYIVGIDTDILKARLEDSSLTDIICENRKLVDLWGIKIPEDKMPINEHYKSNVLLVPVFDVVSDVQTVVGGLTTNTLYPIVERKYGIETGVDLANDLMKAYNEGERQV